MWGALLDKGQVDKVFRADRQAAQAPAGKTVDELRNICAVKTIKVESLKKELAAAQESRARSEAELAEAIKAERAAEVERASS